MFNNFFLGALFHGGKTTMETLEQIRRFFKYMHANPSSMYKLDQKKAIEYGLELADEVIRLRKEIERLETALDAAIARAGDDN